MLTGYQQYVCTQVSHVVQNTVTSTHACACRAQSFLCHHHPTAFIHTLIPQPSLAHSPTTLTGTLTHNSHSHTSPSPCSSPLPTPNQDQDLKQYLDRCNGIMSITNVRVCIQGDSQPFCSFKFFLFIIQLFLFQLLRGLEYCHKRKVLHR